MELVAGEEKPPIDCTKADPTNEVQNEEPYVAGMEEEGASAILILKILTDRQHSVGKEITYGRCLKSETVLL